MQSSGVTMVMVESGPHEAPLIELSPHSMPGVLVTFEGVDGSGKTTSIGALSSILDERKIDHSVVRMASPAARQLPYFRMFADDYASPADGRVDAASVFLTMLADRLVVLRQQVIPLLSAGAWVLCDRYIYMTFAQLSVYGCHSRDLEVINSLASLFPRPDLGFVTTIDASEAMNRIHSRPHEKHRPINSTYFAEFGKAREVSYQ